MAHKAAGRRIRWTFARCDIARLPASLQRYAVKQSDTILRLRLLRASALFDGWLQQVGDRIVCVAPHDSWVWLCGMCEKIGEFSVGAALARGLGRITPPAGDGGESGEDTDD